MKFCPNCGTELNEDVTACPACGAPITPDSVVAVANEYDHTAEFDAADIQKNKIFAVLGYLLFPVGLVIAFLAAKESPFAMFHAKQALKIEVTMYLVIIATSLLFWTCIVPIAAVVIAIILTIVEIIAIFQVFMGIAKEPWLVRSLKFLGK